jgi:hypothetical protein
MKYVLPIPDADPWNANCPSRFRGWGGCLLKCPITGEDVVPGLALLRNIGDRIVECPSCGQRHRWLILASKLVELIEPDGAPKLDEEQRPDE